MNVITIEDGLKKSTFNLFAKSRGFRNISEFLKFPSHLADTASSKAPELCYG